MTDAIYFDIPRTLWRIAGTKYDIGEEFTRPVDDIGILNNLQGEEVNEFLADVETKITGYYVNIFSWLIPKPTDKGLVEANNNLFIYSESSTNHAINSREGEMRFLEEIQKDTQQPIFIIGSRGAGKTFCINRFINNHMVTLEGKGIILFRVELSKMYKKWSCIFENKKDTETVGDNETLEDYIKMHVIYIAYSNALTSTIFRELIKGNGERFLIFIASCLRRTDRKNDIDSVCEKYKLFLGNLENISNEWSDVNKQFIVASMGISKGVIDIAFLYEFILRFLKSKQYRVLYIFDGIDNVCYCRHAYVLPQTETEFFSI